MAVMPSQPFVYLRQLSRYKVSKCWSSKFKSACLPLGDFHRHCLQCHPRTRQGKYTSVKSKTKSHGGMLVNLILLKSHARTTNQSLMFDCT